MKKLLLLLLFLPGLLQAQFPKTIEVTRDTTERASVQGRMAISTPGSTNWDGTLVGKDYQGDNFIIATARFKSCQEMRQMMSRMVPLTAVRYMLDEKGREGEFRLDLSDSNTPDDGVMTLVTSNGRRLKRLVGESIQAPWFGLVADGVGNGTGTNNTTALQKAINAAAAYRKKLIIPADPSGLMYTIYGSINIPSNTTIQFEFGAAIDAVNANVANGTGIFNAAGTAQNAITTVTQPIVNSVKTITVASTSGLAPGDYIIINCPLKDFDQQRPGSGSSDMFRIESIFGNEITLDGTTNDSYPAGTTVIDKINPVKNITLSGLTLKGGGSAKTQWAGVLITRGANITINALNLSDLWVQGLGIETTWNITTFQANIRNVLEPGTGYGILYSGVKTGLVDGLIADKCRHAFDAGGGYVSRFVQVTNSQAKNCISAGFSTHGKSQYVQFSNLMAIDCGGGIVMRGPNSSIDNVDIKGWNNSLSSYHAGIRIGDNNSGAGTGRAGESLMVKGARVEDLGPNTSAIGLVSSAPLINASISFCEFKGIQSNLIELQGNYNKYTTISNNTLDCSAQKTGTLFGILQTFKFAANFPGVACADTVMNYVHNTIIGPLHTGLRVSGSTDSTHKSDQISLKSNTVTNSRNRGYTIGYGYFNSAFLVDNMAIRNSASGSTFDFTSGTISTLIRRGNDWNILGQSTYFSDPVSNTLLTGSGSGQTIYGGSANGGSLTISSTSAGTKGLTYFGTGTNRTVYNEVSKRLGIGIESPIVALDVVGHQVLGADISSATARTDATTKRAFIESVGYNTAGLRSAMLFAENQAASNVLRMGGGSSQHNASTAIFLYAAANATTPTGTAMLGVRTGGVTVNKGESGPSFTLDVNGTFGAKFSSGSAAPTTSQLPEGYFNIYKNAGKFGVYYNDGGTIGDILSSYYTKTESDARYQSVPSTATTAYSAGAIAAGATVTQTVTLTAALGQSASLSAFTTIPGGVRMWSQVTALNTVTHYFQNTTGSEVTPAGSIITRVSN